MSAPQIVQLPPVDEPDQPELPDPDAPEGDGPGLVEEMRAEAEQWRDDYPVLRSVVQFSFRERARIMRAWKQAADGWNRLPSGANMEDPEHLGALYDALADVDDFLGLVAQDLDAYRQWVESHTETEFIQLFVAFARRFRTGEASSSSS